MYTPPDTENDQYLSRYPAVGGGSMTPLSPPWKERRPCVVMTPRPPPSPSVMYGPPSTFEPPCSRYIDAASRFLRLRMTKIRSFLPWQNLFDKIRAQEIFPPRSTKSSDPWGISCIMMPVTFFEAPALREVGSQSAVGKWAEGSCQFRSIPCGTDRLPRIVVSCFSELSMPLLGAFLSFSFPVASSTAASPLVTLFALVGSSGIITSPGYKTGTSSSRWSCSVLDSLLMLTLKVFSPCDSVCSRYGDDQVYKSGVWNACSALNPAQNL